MIREAELSDFIGITRLCDQLGYSVSENEVFERLNNLLNNDDNAVFVAEIEFAGILGWVHVHGRHLIEAHSFAEIGGLVVDAQHRKLGIGEVLMRNCEEWARRKGYKEVRVRSGGQRKEAHAFYKRIGYQNIKRQEVFNLDL
ncbi:Aminoglycoside N(6')-acetyltransferase type 1 [compost metagenome]